ncbi:MAG: HNH endonuclease [Acidimicrobiia bacterium]|nr:HNH endonuclease [Acidimicrobiia bacterium]
MTRTVPPWLRREVEARDHGCRWAGCGRTRWVHIHHVIHWALGGPTNLDNLIMLCGFHHRLLHNDGWTIDGNPNHELRFVNR